MIKSIQVSEVRIGMFIHDIDASWVNHPFWKSSFKLESLKDIEKLKSSNVRQVFIDTRKGLDVLAIEPSEDDSDKIPVLDKVVNANPAPTHNFKSLSEVKPTSILHERAQAMRVISSTRVAISAMFKDVRMGNAISTEGAEAVVDEIAQSVFRNQSALVSLVRLKTKEDFTYLHSVAVCALMISLAKELNLPETLVRQAGLAGLMHDLGKAFVDSNILNKPGSLTDDEFDHMKQHPKLGYDALVASGVSDDAILDVCLHHHEKIDGSGYPEKLAGDQISLFAKMGAVCDVYDAITSNRPYKAGWEPGVSLHRMTQWKGHFDPVILSAFVKSLGIYPVGSVVLLKSGKLAVVIDQNKSDITSPIVKVFYSTKSKTRVPPSVIDLAHTPHDSIMGHADPVAFGILNTKDLWLT